MWAAGLACLLVAVKVALTAETMAVWMVALMVDCSVELWDA